jgi:hypothetical protein
MKRVAVRLLPAVFLALAACHDETGDDPRSALWGLWPGEDGSAWSYVYEERVWGELLSLATYPTAGEVPPAPSLAEAAALLGSHAVVEPYETKQATYELELRGLVTTMSGVTAQRLITRMQTGALRQRDGTDGRGGSALLAQLRAARPDLRAKLDAEHGAPDPRTDPIPYPLAFIPVLLDGYAWARTPDWIGGYGDVDRQPSWRYLEANLEPGAEFTFQLVPSLTDDVFLHSRVLARTTVETPAGMFPDAVVCLYVIDFGVSTVRGDDGTVFGYYQVFTYGTVAYAYGVGPVASYERPLVSTGDPPGPGGGDFTLELAEWSIPGF